MSSETTIYWYPMGSGALETIVLPFITSLADEIPDVVAATSETTAGGMHRQLFGDWRELILLRQHLRPEHATEEAVVQGLRSLQSHLIAGYSIGIAVGENKAYASLCPGYTRGTTTIIAPPTIYSAWSTASTPDVGDEVMVQSKSPDGAREVMEVQSRVAVGTSYSFTFTRGLRYDHTSGILLRHRQFYPAMKWPEDQLGNRILTSSNNDRTFDLRLELREDMQELWTVAEGGQQLTGSVDYGWTNTPAEIDELSQRARNLRPF